MGNLCSIYHAHFDKLVALTNSHNKAVFLDKCIFWWQISTYTLGDDKIWFTRKLSEIAKELSISERSISRYLEEFAEKGLLERTCKLSASNKNDHFSVTKRLYIRVTDKLLNLLQVNSSDKDESLKSQQKCSFSNQHGEIDKDNLASSIYKDKDHNQINNNTVSHAGIVNNFEKPIETPTSKSNQSQINTYPVEVEIGERITPQLKNYIKGMLGNVQKQYALKISDPNKLFAEVVFSVTQDIQWQGVDNLHHRVNIIAKLLREKQWKTPKGFYNHWDIGQIFREKEQKRFRLAQNQKIQDGGIANQLVSQKLMRERDIATGIESRFNDEYRFSKPKQYEKNIEIQKLKSSLNEISLNLCSEESYLRQLESWVTQQKPGVTQALIESVAIKIASLYDKKQALLFTLESLSVQAA